MHQFWFFAGGAPDEPGNRPDRPLCRQASPAKHMTRPPHILLVEAPYYAHIAAELRRGAERALAAVGATHERIAVPGAFEIPAAIGIAGRASERFDGFVALGCVIRGETTHYDHICAESARGLPDFAIREGLPIGYGLLTGGDEA